VGLLFGVFLLASGSGLAQLTVGGTPQVDPPVRTGLAHRGALSPPPLPPPSYSVTLVVRSGDEPPERPGEVFTSFSDPTVNASGQLAFKGNFDGPLSGNEGVYRVDPGSSELVRLVDDSFDFNPPGQSGATHWAATEAGWFDAGFVQQTGVYLGTVGGGLLRAADETMVPPGQAPSARFTGFDIFMALNAGGDLAFKATYSGGTGGHGVYLWDGATVVRVLDESDISLGVDLSNFHMMLGIGGSGGQDGKPATLGDGGHVVFRASLAGGGEAIILATPG
jgi:hypothetical protein